MRKKRQVFHWVEGDVVTGSVGRRPKRTGGKSKNTQKDVLDGFHRPTETLKDFHLAHLGFSSGGWEQPIRCQRDRINTRHEPPSIGHSHRQASEGRFAGERAGMNDSLTREPGPDSGAAGADGRLADGRQADGSLADGSLADGRLVRRTLSGRGEAYAELVRRWTHRVLALCHALVRNRSVAEDLTQEAFVRAYIGLGSLKEPEKFAPWLRGIARRACLDWIRSRQRIRSLNQR